MARTHVVQVRLDDEEAAELERLAKELDLSKSGILRMGIAEARAGARRMALRRKNMHKLIKMAEEIPGPEDDSWKARF